MNERYQKGGDIYEKLRQSYGTAGADYIASVDRAGGSITDAIVKVKYGGYLPDSTTAIFVDKITTDPLAAPLESANRQIGNVVLGVFKNPWVLAALAVYVFLQLGGWDYLKGKLK